MKLIDFLDLTTCEDVRIVQDGKLLFAGKVDNAPYKYMRREMFAFGFVLDGLEIILQAAI